MAKTLIKNNFSDKIQYQRKDRLFFGRLSMVTKIIETAITLFEARLTITTPEREMSSPLLKHSLTH